MLFTDLIRGGTVEIHPRGLHAVRVQAGVEVHMEKEGVAVGVAEGGVQGVGVVCLQAVQPRSPS